MTTRVYRQPVGMSAAGPVFVHTADGCPPVTARDAFDACRQLMRYGLSGEVEIVTSTGMVSRRANVEAMAALRIEESNKLRIRPWRPLNGQGGKSTHRKARAAVLGKGADEAKSASVLTLATGVGHSGKRVRLESDAEQWVLIIGSRRHYCRSRAGLERWLGRDHPLIGGTPAWHHELMRAVAPGGLIFSIKKIGAGLRREATVSA